MGGTDGLTATARGGQRISFQSGVPRGHLCCEMCPTNGRHPLLTVCSRLARWSFLRKGGNRLRRPGHQCVGSRVLGPALRARGARARPRARCRFPGGKPARRPGLTGIARKWPGNWRPSGLGPWRRRSLQAAWPGDEPGQPSAASLGGSGAQATLAADAPGPVWASKAFPFRRGATWPLSSLLPPCLLSAPVKGFRAASARAVPHCPSGTGHRGLEWTSGPPRPPQPGHLWPHGTRRQGQPDPGKGHAPLRARRAPEHPWQKPAWCCPCHGGFLRRPCHARAPPARRCLLRLRNGGRVGEGASAITGGAGPVGSWA